MEPIIPTPYTQVFILIHMYVLIIMEPIIPTYSLRYIFLYICKYSCIHSMIHSDIYNTILSIMEPTLRYMYMIPNP